MGQTLGQNRRNDYIVMDDEDEDEDEKVNEVISVDAKNISRGIDREIKTDKLRRKTMQNIVLLGRLTFINICITLYMEILRGGSFFEEILRGIKYFKFKFH